jgi:hypothetical protein
MKSQFGPAVSTVGHPTMLPIPPTPVGHQPIAAMPNYPVAPHQNLRDEKQDVLGTFSFSVVHFSAGSLDSSFLLNDMVHIIDGVARDIWATCGDNGSGVPWAIFERQLLLYFGEATGAARGLGREDLIHMRVMVAQLSGIGSAEIVTRDMFARFWEWFGGFIGIVYKVTQPSGPTHINDDQWMTPCM